MGIGNGWFKDPQLGYSWSWLAGRYRIDESMALEKKDFGEDPFLFDRIDRNGDGKIEAADFDWSPTACTCEKWEWPIKSFDSSINRGTFGYLEKS